MILRSLFESPFSMILAFLPIPYLKLAAESLQYKYRWNRSTKKGSSPVLGDGYREGHWFGVHSPCLGVPCLPGFRLFDFGYLHIHSAILRVEPKLKHQLLYVFMRVLPDLILYIFRVLVFWLRFITGGQVQTFPFVASCQLKVPKCFRRGCSCYTHCFQPHPSTCALTKSSTYHLNLGAHLQHVWSHIHHLPSMESDSLPDFHVAGSAAIPRDMLKPWRHHGLTFPLISTSV